MLPFPLPLSLSLALLVLLSAIMLYRPAPTQTNSTFNNTSQPVQLPDEPMTTSPFPPCPPIPKADGPVELLLAPTEDRPHRYFTLPNGLEAIVVSDPKADKAAASMDVGVGHLSDPDNLPGCAHFWYAFISCRIYPFDPAPPPSRGR